MVGAETKCLYRDLMYREKSPGTQPPKPNKVCTKKQSREAQPHKGKDKIEAVLQRISYVLTPTLPFPLSFSSSLPCTLAVYTPLFSYHCRAAQSLPDKYRVHNVSDLLFCFVPLAFAFAFCDLPLPSLGFLVSHHAIHSLSLWQ